VVTGDNKHEECFRLGLSSVDIRTIACPCCGDLNLNDDLWPRLDAALCLFSEYEYSIMVGYLCWQEARNRYAQSLKAESKRFRLSGVYEQIYRGNAMVLSFTPGMEEEFGLAMRAAGLAVTETDLGMVVSTGPIDYRSRDVKKGASGDSPATS